MSWPNVYGQPGMSQVGRVVRGQLEEPADRRAALVQLAGRVEEARAVAGGRRPAGPVAQQRADPGEGLVALGRRGDERLEAQVGVRPAAREVALQLARRRRRRPRSAGAPHRRTGRGRRRSRSARAHRSPASSACPSDASTSRVSCLASSTLGWSNGSMPSTARRSPSRPPSGRPPRRGRSGRSARSG